jgi:hypothetical protein
LTAVGVTHNIVVCVKFHSAGGDAIKVLTGIGAGNLIVNPTVHKFVEIPVLFPLKNPRK